MLKEKVSLGVVQETLLITLWARAVEASQQQPILYDSKAVDILSQIDYNFNKVSKSLSSQLIVCIRGQTIDQLVKNFLQNYPRTTVIEIGAGLNTRFERLDNGTLNWFDLDLADSMAVRQRFFEESDRRKFISGSVLESHWINKMKTSISNPLLFIAEGVLVYFTESQVKQLFAMLADNFPGSFLIFDAISPFMVKYHRNWDAIKYTSANLQWGIKNIQEIETWDSRYKVENSLYFSDCSQYFPRFPLIERLLITFIPYLTRTSGMHLVRLG
ncbi:tetracenomycin C synthesis protein [Nostoc sp. KVJ20]|uniref:class I SAM-dependent methyltransferase n=1 Tax=Nostoc sp. KVJ20 TaxID=457944 RepID=UPI00083D5D35|nr:class I SAM-dependent methyltransferase [Nostoc sp. KVJ20]ODG99986.1 tetracenomycin C synthesis protein [Nostoc sp. KVJ20]